jgi:hypothetical protein
MAHVPDRPTETAAASSLEERELVDGLLAGEPRAVSDFLERTHHPVFCMACRLTGDSDLRRDWAHTTLLGILEDLKRGRFVRSPRGGYDARDGRHEQEQGGEPRAPRRPRHSMGLRTAAG